MTRLFSRTSRIALGTLLVLGSGFISPDSRAAEDEAIAEVLIFVDVSGSMIKNDPKNMRAPAIRMLAGMTPEDARVGIYLFGTRVRELVAPAKVNRAWKKKAEKASSHFRSRDMYTNIEEALKIANKKWSGNKNSKRSVILLTDGIVDIDKNKSISDASRERILGPVLSELKQKKVNVHTIALSEHADHELLQQLAFHTDGNNQQAENAEGLQRNFMRLFEQSAPQDTLPLAGNAFTVDSSISELTLLIFSKPGSEPTQIITPDGETYTQSYAVDGLSWNHDTGYDLISVAHPIQGEWRIIADEDPDNRAMVVTDLKLKTRELPTNILNGEVLDWVVWLENKGEVISKAEFLKLLSATLSDIKDGKVEQSWTLQPANESGQFLQRLGPEWQTGKLELLLKIDGGTFVREKRLSIQSYASPIEIHSELMNEETLRELSGGQAKKIPKNILSPDEHSETTQGWNIDSQAQGWKIDVKAKKELIDLSASELVIETKSQTGVVTSLTAEKNEHGWSLDFLPHEIGQHQLSVVFKGEGLTGRKITTELEPLLLGEIASPVDPVVIEEIADKEVDEGAPSTKHFIIPVVFGNILFLLLFFGWKYLKRTRDSANLQPEEAL